jgi:ribosomal protein L11 methyltransferase
MNWLEVSLTVDGELAEAVADVLRRFAPNGVTTEQAVKYNTEEEAGTPIGPITVRAFLPADEKVEATRKALEESLHYLGMIQPLPAPTFTPIADQNWMEAWKTRYQPIPIGKRLIIVPAWLESPDDSRIPIKIDPGMAFGTGTHPTTQLCLEFIEEYFDQANPTTQQPVTVIDIGCGSGILSIGALKLGASFALGVDIDEAAVHASRENARANAIPDEQFALGAGSVTEISTGKYQIQNAPLVLANILAPVLVRLFEVKMADLVTPGGTIILSGILEEQTDDVIKAAQAQGMVLSGRKQSGDWVALRFQLDLLVENKQT